MWKIFSMAIFILNFDILLSGVNLLRCWTSLPYCYRGHVIDLCSLCRAYCNILYFTITEVSRNKHCKNRYRKEHYTLSGKRDFIDLFLSHSCCNRFIAGPPFIEKSSPAIDVIIPLYKPKAAQYINTQWWNIQCSL